MMVSPWNVMEMPTGHEGGHGRQRTERELVSGASGIRAQMKISVFRCSALALSANKLTSSVGFI